jgi:hypothetical protein
LACLFFFFLAFNSPHDVNRVSSAGDAYELEIKKIDSCGGGTERLSGIDEADLLCRVAAGC